MNEENKQRFLTINELCKYMNISQTKAREFIIGKGFTLRIGNKILIDKIKLNEWINKNLR